VTDAAGVAIQKARRAALLFARKQAFIFLLLYHCSVLPVLVEWLRGDLPLVHRDWTVNGTELAQRLASGSMNRCLLALSTFNTISVYLFRIVFAHVTLC